MGEDRDKCSLTVADGRRLAKEGTFGSHRDDDEHEHDDDGDDKDVNEQEGTFGSHHGDDDDTYKDQMKRAASSLHVNNCRCLFQIYNLGLDSVIHHDLMRKRHPQTTDPPHNQQHVRSKRPCDSTAGKNQLLN